MFSSMFSMKNILTYFVCVNFILLSAVARLLYFLFKNKLRYSL